MLLTWILLYRVCCMCFLPVYLPTHVTMVALRGKIRQPVLRPIIPTTMPHAQQTFSLSFAWEPYTGNCMHSVYSERQRLTVACSGQSPSRSPPRAEYSWVPLSVISVCALERQGQRAPPTLVALPRSPADTFVRLANTLARWQFSRYSKAPPEKRSETVTSQSHT